MSSLIAQIKFNSDGLVPAVLQDSSSNEVLMLAWMNEAALKQTLETKVATFFSRSRNEIWVKGATSGNTMHVKTVKFDCDADVLLLQVQAAGPACHTGSRSCFSAEIDLGDLG